MYILKHKKEELYLNRSTKNIVEYDINKSSTYLEYTTAITSLMELRTKLKMFTKYNWSDFEPVDVKLIKL
jgi:hypothetical protein